MRLFKYLRIQWQKLVKKNNFNQEKKKKICQDKFKIKNQQL